MPTTYVTDHTALTSIYSRWNGADAVGTPVTIAYTFLAGDDVPTTAEHSPFMPGDTNNYVEMDAGAQAATRLALAQFSSVSGVHFVEVDDPELANIEFLSNYGNGDYSWAYSPYSYQGYSNSATVTMTEWIDPQYHGTWHLGSWQFNLVMHEIGHAMGLDHPHEGVLLDPSLDNHNHTIMSYDWTWDGNTSPNYYDRATLGPLDVQALEYLYGASTFTTLGWTTLWDEVTDTFTLTGHTGDDVLIALRADSALNGGEGADTLYGQGGDDTLNGGSGADEMHGGGGTDAVSYDGALDGGGIRLDGGAGWGLALGDVLTSIENAFGSAHNDVIVGSGVANLLAGGDGEDVLFGQLGDDRLYGGLEDDTLVGGGGADSLYGGSGFDTASYDGATGGGGIRLDGGAGWGHAFGDVFSSIENVIGSAYGDVIVGNGVANLMSGGGGADSLFGGGGDDTLNGGSGADEMHGGGGTDAVSYDGALDGGGIRLDGGAGWGLALGDVLTSIENAFGSAHNDVIVGSGVANLLAGGDGEDVLFGQLGDDRLYGGLEDDTLVGGGGADSLYGGSGFDTASYDGATGGGGIRLDGGAGWGHAFGDVFSSIENVIGSAYGDVIVGNGVANLLSGGGGADSLFGGGGDDTLYGGSGADVLIGGFGADTMFGNSGTDTFVYNFAAESTNAGTSWDRIIGFTHGEDLIDLSAFNARFIGTDAYAGNGNIAEVRIFEDANGDTRVFVDVNADGTSDLRFYLVDTLGVMADDFIL